MGESTSIQWTDATWPITGGCTRVSAGCDHCYAVAMSRRLAAMANARMDAGKHPDGLGKYLHVVNPGKDHFNGTVNLDRLALAVPFRWKKPRRIFVNSMSDLFHREVPFAFIDLVWDVMRRCPQHTFQVLTKRPERMAMYVQDRRGDILPNVWLGTSVEDQATADERIPHLLRCRAAVRFVSQEPQLGPVNLSTHLAAKEATAAAFFDSSAWHNKIHLVIQGGESGPGARPFEVAWARQTRDECAAAGVAYFLKQMGGNPRSGNAHEDDWLAKLTDGKGGDMSEWPAEFRVQQMPKTPQQAGTMTLPGIEGDDHE